MAEMLVRHPTVGDHVRITQGYLDTHEEPDEISQFHLDEEAIITGVELHPDGTWIARIDCIRYSTWVHGSLVYEMWEANQPDEEDVDG